MSQQPLLVTIQEAECIGCTHCIAACPVDAIIGAKGQMHTVISQFCIGCQLCIDACPVQCITLTAQPATHQPHITKARHKARKERLSHLMQQKTMADTQAQLVDMKKAIQEAITRAKQKS